jgi:hypothetical protein
MRATSDGDCLACTSAHALFTTTSSILAVSNATTGCICVGSRPQSEELTFQRGYYTTPSENVVSELAKSNVKDRILCLTCPDGADCASHDGMRLAELSAKRGYWRPTPNSTVFSNCLQAYEGTSGSMYAEQRCCPNNKTTNISICKDQIFVSSDNQCKHGYSGILCASCAENFVMLNGECSYCQGGSSLDSAFIAACISCVPVFLVVLIFLLFSNAERAAEKGSAVINQFKIFLSFVQILSSMPGVYSGVPWPSLFLEVTVPLGVINLDLFSLFRSPESCQLSVNFLHRFAVHMALPGLLLVSLILAYVFASICGKKVKSAKKDRAAKITKIIILGTLFMYPGLCTSIFSVFRCKKIDGVDGQWLVADFSIKCHQRVHETYSLAAFVFFGVYILGVPLLVLIVLFTHRKSLHDESHPNHQQTKYELGGLYGGYEAKYWWYELVIIIHKMFMTGAMCVIGSGTPIQPLVACLFQLSIVMVNLKLGPYESAEDDWSAFVSGLTLQLTMFIGFALITDVEDSFDVNIIAYILIFITVASSIFNLVTMMWVCFNELNEKRVARKFKKAKKLKIKEQQPLLTTIVPVSAVEIFDAKGGDKGYVWGDDGFLEHGEISAKSSLFLDNLIPSQRSRLPSLIDNGDFSDSLHLNSTNIINTKRSIPNVSTNVISTISLIVLLLMPDSNMAQVNERGWDQHINKNACPSLSSLNNSFQLINEIKLSDDADYKMFFHNYLRPLEPAIIKGGTKFWPSVSNVDDNGWTYDYLQKIFFSESLKFHSDVSENLVAYYKQSNGESLRLTLLHLHLQTMKQLRSEKKSAKESNYLFHRGNFFEGSSPQEEEIRRKYTYWLDDSTTPWPRSIDILEQHNKVWKFIGIGSSGSGTSLHQHRHDSYLGIVEGVKRVELFSPIYNDNEQAQKNISNRFIVDVSRGDMVYIPSNWFHKTINCAETVSVAAQVLYNHSHELEKLLFIISKTPKRALMQTRKRRRLARDCAPGMWWERRDCDWGCSTRKNCDKCIDECWQCSTGRFLPSNNHYISSCNYCLPGSFASGKGASRCADCPKGYYQDESGKTVCKKCSQGKVSDGDIPPYIACRYCKKGKYMKDIKEDIICSTCNVGKYNGIENSLVTQCLPCNSAGKYAGQSGAIFCDNCEIGRSTPEDIANEQGFAGYINCEDCPSGKFASSSGKVCKNCRTGKFTSSSGQSSCKVCPSGFYQEQNGKTFCFSCSPGMWMPSSDEGKLSCSVCPEGWISENPVAHECLQCATGRNSAEGVSKCSSCVPGKVSFLAAGPCDDCEEGSFQENMAQTECKQCPTGFYSKEKGQAICLGCLYGKYANTTGMISCKLCAENLYQDQRQQDSCKACQDGKVSASGSKTCQSCSIGRKRSQTVPNYCDACEIGQHQNFQGKNFCRKCPAGYQQNLTAKGFCFPCIPGRSQNKEGSNQCLPCKKNMYGNTTAKAFCTHCPAGWVSKNGSTSCNACGMGFHYHINKCISCKPGKFSSLQARLRCESCPTGFYQPIHAQGTCLPCVPGEYSNSVEQTECKSCPLLFYTNTSGKSTCSLCPRGWETVVNGSIKCSTCPVGRYGEKDKIGCWPCEVGRFRQQNDVLLGGVNNCRLCPSGYFQHKTGIGLCLECATGLYQDEQESTYCKDCDILHYTDTLASTNCTICPSGFQTQQRKSVLCVTCPQGRFGNGTKKPCEKCSIGKYRREDYIKNDLDLNRCVECPAGFFQALRGQGLCQSCEMGRYSSENGTVKCEDCAINYFTPISGMTNCIDCPNGYEAKLNQSVSCSKCSTGTYGEKFVLGCSMCEPGKFRRNDDVQLDACRGCPKGFYQPLNRQGRCFLCSPGKYQENSNSVVCCNCPAGYYRLGKYVDSSRCVRCVPGQTTLKNGSEACQACSLGRYGWTSTINTKLNGGYCEACSAGKYQDAKGEIQCKACPVDTFNELEGVTALSGCKKCREFYAAFTTTSNLTGIGNATTGCICTGARPNSLEISEKAGFYTVPPHQAKTEQKKEEPADRVLCVPCPSGADCEFDGMGLVDISAIQGHWRPHNMSKIFSDCKKGYSVLQRDSLALERCCSLNATTNASICKSKKFKNSDEQCQKGYGGALCLVCAKNYVKIEDDCVECIGGASLNLAFLVAGMSCLPIIFIALIFLLCSSAEKNVENANGLIGQIKIMLTFVQIISAMPSVLPQVPWPIPFLAINPILSVFNINIFSIIEHKDRCQLSVSFLNQFVVHMAYPFMLLFAVTMGYCISHCIGKKSKEAKQHRRAQIFKMILLGTLTVYPGLCTRIFTVFRCKEIDGVNGKVLDADVSQSCYQGDHAKFLIVAFIFMGVYVIGIPLGILIVLCTKRDSLHNEKNKRHIETQYKLGGL